jgi:UDP:flavonoid glycosyltransferase YjiC (YdhE family)
MVKTLLFAPEAHNLAEVTRMLEIAKEARRDFRCVFLSYDGTHRNYNYIVEEGFEIRELEPQLTEEKIQRWWSIDRGEKFGDIFTEADLRKRIESERSIYEELKPAAVLTGFCLSIPISARVAGVPLVWVTQTTWLLEHVKKYSTWPDAIDYPVLRIIPDRWLNRLSAITSDLSFSLLTGFFNKVAVTYGVGPFPGSTYFEGDYTLFAEPEGFTDTPVPDRLQGRYRYTGALFARLNYPVPPEIELLPHDKPVIYFAMGSSGAEETVIRILQAFEGTPYNVIAPVKPLITRLKVQVPPNVIATGYLPAHKVNPMADISVIHGGIGTVMTACYSGTPIVGIANGNPEQEWNLDTIVRKGFAIRLRKKRVTAEHVIKSIESLLHNDDARQKAQDFQAVLKEWNGPANAADFLNETFG